MVHITRRYDGYMRIHTMHSILIYSTRKLHISLIHRLDTWPEYMHGTHTQESAVFLVSTPEKSNLLTKIWKIPEALDEIYNLRRFPSLKKP